MSERIEGRAAEISLALFLNIVVAELKAARAHRDATEERLKQMSEQVDQLNQALADLQSTIAARDAQTLKHIQDLESQIVALQGQGIDVSGPLSTIGTIKNQFVADQDANDAVGTAPAASSPAPATSDNVSSGAAPVAEQPAADSSQASTPPADSTTAPAADGQVSGGASG